MSASPEEILAAVEAFLSNAGSAISRLQSLIGNMPKVEGDIGNAVSQITSALEAIVGHHATLHVAVKGEAPPAAPAAPAPSSKGSKG